MKRVFSGMRPTGRLHLGHLFGALESWVQLQQTHQCIYGVVDWHALTTDYEEPSKVSDNTLEVALDWLAVGLDPNRSILMVQSQVLEHAELHLLFSMITPIAWLERVPTYKEQRQQLSSKDLSTYGFLGYPLLQAADILVYKGDVVPVGEDQLSHIELTREVARRFNHLYGPVFPEPQALLTKTSKLPGTDGRKMSKSYGNEIQLAASPDEVKEKIMNMMTDPARKRRSDPGNPDVCPVFDYHKVFTGAERRSAIDRECRTAAIGCVDDKKILLENVLKVLEPISERRQQWARDPDTVRDILKDGNRRARQIAAATMEEVRSAIGLAS
ncbi:MAG: tryptophan--tRNA ligase [Acidobacteriota bacterium]